MACEISVDRAYQPNGTLLPRGRPGAIIDEPVLICMRVADILREGAIIAADGTRIDSICVHSDTPDAVGIASTLRSHLEAGGLAIKSFVSPLT